MSTPTTNPQDYEERLAALHRLTRDLLELHNPKDVATHATDTATQLLNAPLGVIYTYNEDDNTFTPFSITDTKNITEDDPLPTLTEESHPSLHQQYCSNTAKLYQNPEEISTRYDAGLESVLCIPLEDLGLFLVGTTERSLDNEDDQQLLEILAGNVEVAFELAEREQQLEQYQQELEETVEELETSNAELEQFAYVASHDLQEPLRMISSYLSLLEMELESDLDEETQEYIDYAVDGAERMKQLIDDLLKYSRVETQEREFEEHDLNDTLESVEQDLTFLIDEKNGELTSDDLPTIKADQSQMKQLFQNLIANAFKYDHPDRNPVVNVTSETHTNSVTIHIEDNGQGISEEQQERIFEVFTRGDTDEDDDDGTGIGLAVCKRIVEGHGGELSVESTEGEGTTFSFTLEKDPTQ